MGRKDALDRLNKHNEEQASKPAASDFGFPSAESTEEVTAPESAVISSHLLNMKRAFEDSVSAIRLGTMSADEAARNREVFIVQDAAGFEWGLDDDGNFLRRQVGDLQWTAASPFEFVEADDMGFSEVGIMVQPETRSPSKASSAASVVSEKAKAAKEKRAASKAAKAEASTGNHAVTPAASTAGAKVPRISIPSFSMPSARFIAPVALIALLVGAMALTRGGDTIPEVADNPEVQITVAPELTTPVVTIPTDDGSRPQPTAVSPDTTTVSSPASTTPSASASPVSEADILALVDILATGDPAVVAQYFPEGEPSQGRQVSLLGQWYSYKNVYGAEFSISAFSYSETLVTAEVSMVVSGEKVAKSTIRVGLDRDSGAWIPTKWPTISTVG